MILDFSGEILNGSASPIVWTAILRFLPVHLSPVTEQNCRAKCLQEGHARPEKHAGVKDAVMSRCLMDSCGCDDKNSPRS